MSLSKNFETITPADQQLIDAAIGLVEQERPYPDRHRIGTAMLTESGETFLGVCIQAEFVKPTGVCAERIALGQWAMQGCCTESSTH